MKSLEELAAIREKMKNNTTLREGEGEIRAKMIVGMATCGIAAGARPVLNAIVSELEKRNITDVVVAQTGCIGMCRLEPIVDVLLPGKEKVSYVKMSPDKVARVITEHIVNGRPVQEYTVAAYKGETGDGGRTGNGAETGSDSEIGNGGKEAIRKAQEKRGGQD